MPAILNFFTATNKSAFPNKQKQISFPSLMNPWREVWILHVNVLCSHYLFLCVVFSPSHFYCLVQQHKYLACFPTLSSFLASASLKLSAEHRVPPGIQKLSKQPS